MFFKIQKESKEKEKPKVFLKWLQSRINKNLNAIIVFNGGTGSGKSFACIRLGIDASEMLNTHFSIENNVAFKFKDSLIKMQLKQNQKAGTVFIMEEVGAFGSGASAREWQSQANKFFFSFLQTARHRQQILILNCPSYSYLEKGSRELVHFVFDATSIDIQKKLSYFKPFAIQINRRTGKPYFKFLRYKFDGIKRRMDRMMFALPPDDYIKEYEAEKLKFTTALNKSMMEQQNIRQRGQGKEHVKNRTQAIKKLVESGNSKRYVANLLGISERTVFNHLLSKDNKT